MIYKYVLLLCCLLVLSGCGETIIADKTQTITFDQFSFDIPLDFVSIDSSLVENKQILHKVLKSFKRKVTNGFASNIIITRSALSADLDYEQFWAANAKKLAGYLVNYQADDQQLISFVCRETTIKGILVTFHVGNTFVGNSAPYALAQYQFVHQGHGYIISFASATIEDLESMTQKISDISCLPGTTIVDLTGASTG